MAAMMFRKWIDGHGTVALWLSADEVSAELEAMPVPPVRLHYEPLAQVGCQYSLACVKPAKDVLRMPWGLIVVCVDCRSFYFRQV